MSKRLESPELRHEQYATKRIQVERKSKYQGVPQYGITGSAEITPSRATAEKWARLENAARSK